MHRKIAPSPKIPEDPRRLPVLLRRAWYGLNQAFRRRIAHTRCTPDQYTVLRNLSETGPRGLTQAQLTRAMSSDPNTIASLVGRMERLRLLTREPDPGDRRARRLRMTSAGKARFEELRRIAQHLQEEVLAILPPSSRRRFLSQLERVANACRDSEN